MNVRRLGAAAFVCAMLAQAHEIGTTRVAAAFHASPRAFTIDIVTDAATLAEKLEAAAGRPAIAPADVLAAIASGEPLLRRKIDLRFDREPATFNMQFVLVDNGGVRIRLSGETPAGARAFTWSYGWTYASYSLTAGARTVWLEGDQRSAAVLLDEVTIAPSPFETAARYLALGFTHILPLGLDHMLFVLGIYLLNAKLRTVLWQVSAFTVAHSITLGLSMYGVLDVSPRIVEPAIAISIAYVAIENLLVSQLKPWRIVLVFLFGLLHGMGFAGALREVGLPAGEFFTALVTFNIGVEAGQLAVIGAAFLLFGWRYAERPWYRQRIAVPASLAIAAAALYWTVERMLSATAA